MKGQNSRFWHKRVFARQPFCVNPMSKKTLRLVASIIILFFITDNRLNQYFSQISLSPGTFLAVINQTRSSHAELQYVPTICQSADSFRFRLSSMTSTSCRGVPEPWTDICPTRIRNSKTADTKSGRYVLHIGFHDPHIIVWRC